MLTGRADGRRRPLRLSVLFSSAAAGQFAARTPSNLPQPGRPKRVDASTAAGLVLPCAKPMRVMLLLVQLLHPLALTVAAPLGETVELRGGVAMP